MSLKTAGLNARVETGQLFERRREASGGRETVLTNLEIKLEA